MKKLTDDILRRASAVNEQSTLIKQIQKPFKTSWQYASKIAGTFAALGNGFYFCAAQGAFTEPNQPHHPEYVSRFCQGLCDAFNVEMTIHGEMPRGHALWVSNHVSWLDIPVVGAAAHVFFLSKAEIAAWPIIGTLASAGGTLFIKRGSGDAGSVQEQMAAFLRRKLPVLFFPEATTTNGLKIKKIYGKLLTAAIMTDTPIQPVVICYVNEHGEQDMSVPFIDDMDLLTHLAHMMKKEKIHAHVMPLEAIDPAGHDTNSITVLLHERMSEGLASLQRRVLLNPYVSEETSAEGELAAV